jgi:hypothetical protein
VVIRIRPEAIPAEHERVVHVEKDGLVSVKEMAHVRPIHTV